MIPQVKPQKARSKPMSDVRCPACRLNFSVPVKENIFEARIACPHCRAWLVVTLGVRWPIARAEAKTAPPRRAGC
jgi:uncharacterized paraquat-inducible protein A